MLLYRGHCNTEQVMSSPPLQYLLPLMYTSWLRLCSCLLLNVPIP